MPNDEALFKGTTFDGTEILWVHELAHLVKIDSNITHSACMGDHYVDVLTNQKFHVKSKPYDNDYCEVFGYSSISYPTFSSVMYYMDSETFNKVKNGTFTDADLLNYMEEVRKKGPEK